MILVLLGTQNNSFHRLLEEIEKNIENGNIKEEVIVQAGYTKYESEKLKIFDTKPREELDKLIDQASLVITHGGVGSMITANQRGKKVIAVPRLKKYHEHVNDHQIATVKAFKEKGYVLEAEGTQNLAEAISKVKDFEPVIYQKKESKIVELVGSFIERDDNSKVKKYQKIHILVIMLGIIFVALSGFHSNLWFDESYSVAIADRTFGEIWTIGGHDVHPILYYWMLKVVKLLTMGWGIVGTSSKILAYRLFSIIPIAILGVMGYTHIRKDFDEKTGILFSFFAFFLPEVAIYANEIRMYSWGLLFISVLSIYALRLTKDSTWKNWLIFFLSSLLSIYTHYYGLMAAGIINLCLLIYLIKNKRKNDIVRIVTFGVIQGLAYLPWILFLMQQMKNVSGGFWIGFTFPNTIMEILSSQYIGNLNYYVGFIISIAIYIYLGVVIHRYKGNKTSVKLSIGIYIAVIIAALIITLFMKTSILYYRYLFIITGLYIFTISFILSKEKNTKIIWLVCAITTVLALTSNIKMIKDNYKEENEEPIKYLQENVQKEDTFVSDQTTFGTGSVVSVWFPDNKQYFYNPDNWHVEEAYKAFGPNFTTVTDTEFLNDLSDRVWIIDNSDKAIYNNTFKDDFDIVSEKLIWTGYHGYCYEILLVERK